MSIFLYHDWMSLSLPTRNKLANKFGIKKTSSTHVVNNQVESDGYSLRDVEKGLNLPAIKEFLGTEESDMQKLWTMLVDKIEDRVPAVIPPTPEGNVIPITTISQVPIAQAIPDEPIKKKVVKSKK